MDFVGRASLIGLLLGAGCSEARFDSLQVVVVPQHQVGGLLETGHPIEWVQEGAAVELEFRADEAATVVVVGRCVHDEEVIRGGCHARLEGERLVIEAGLTAKGMSPADCPPGHVFACETPELAAGSYTVDFAGRELSLVVPSTTPSEGLVFD